MASVYHQAILTIVALGGKDASVGLPGIRPQSRLERGVEVATGVRLCPRKRKLSDIISNSTYNTRAWTYQERLLSRRCLFFTEEQVYFQGDAVILCEDRFKPCPDDHNLIAPLALLARLKLSVREKSWDEAFSYYARFVVDYSRKHLSYQSDIISAFTGITKILELYYGWRFLDGLPVPLIDLALLWAPSTTDSILDSALRRRREFPSWSWSGWTGGVDYELVPVDGLKSKLEALYLEDKIGCYEVTDRILEFSMSRNRSGHTITNSLKPEPTLQSPGEKVKILHFKASTVRASKFKLQAANNHYYFTVGHIFQGLSY